MDLGQEVSLIDADQNDTALLAAEDAAIWAAEHPPEVVSDGTVTAEPGTPLADLIEALNGEPSLPTQAEAVGGAGG